MSAEQTARRRVADNYRRAPQKGQYVKADATNDDLCSGGGTERGAAATCHAGGRWGKVKCLFKSDGFN